MDCFHIHGGGPLQGRVTAAGSKNAALPLLASVLLLDGPTAFSRLPGVRDVDTLLELLTGLGARVLDREGDRVRLECPAEGPTEAPYEVVRRMRASVCVLGPLLARRGRHVGQQVLGPCHIVLLGLAATDDEHTTVHRGRDGEGIPYLVDGRCIEDHEVVVLLEVSDKSFETIGIEE